MNGLENSLEVIRQASGMHRFSDEEAVAIYRRVSHNSKAPQKTTCISPCLLCSLQENSHFSLYSAETAALCCLLKVLLAAIPTSVNLNVIQYKITEALHMGNLIVSLKMVCEE